MTARGGYLPPQNHETVALQRTIAGKGTKPMAVCCFSSQYCTAVLNLVLNFFPFIVTIRPYSARIPIYRYSYRQFRFRSYFFDQFWSI